MSLLLLLSIIYNACLKLILSSAFSLGSLRLCCTSATRYGIARGLLQTRKLRYCWYYAASAKADNPNNQALVSMSATFWDTVVMCAITGLVIVSNILKRPASINQYSIGEYTTAAFNQIPYIGEGLLGISIILFALATLVGWSYFGEKAVEYLFGKEGISTYRLCYIVMVYIGGILTLSFVWELTDLINAFMVVPNLISIFFLYKKIKV